MSTPRSIYLAGKIALGDWRHDVVTGLRSAGVAAGGDWTETGEPWPVLEGAAFGLDYTGPYFISCDHGCAHGPGRHGVGDDGSVEAGGYPGPTRARTVAYCLTAIKKADIFFAWLDGDTDGQCTAYGTLVELGYARAQGKDVVVAGPFPRHRLGEKAGESCGPHGCHCEQNDLWFATTLADIYIRANSPVEALRNLVDHLESTAAEEKIESPLEKIFLDTWLAEFGSLRGLTLQHQVVANSKKYRLDFALPEQKIAFEMDGRTYHNTDKAFAHDRRRDLALSLAGWRIHRFDGDHIRADPQNVVRIAAQLAGTAQ